LSFGGLDQTAGAFGDRGGNAGLDLRIAKLQLLLAVHNHAAFDERRWSLRSLEHHQVRKIVDAAFRIEQGAILSGYRLGVMEGRLESLFAHRLADQLGQHRGGWK
jgi:hypothetical protein